MKETLAMTPKPFQRIFNATLAAVLTITGIVVLGAAPAAQADDDRDGGKLEGTWINAVKIVTCAPTPRVVIATFPSLTTYMRGGVLIEGGGPAGPPPAVSRSASHGIWERTGGHTYRQFFRGHNLDSLGRIVRINEVSGNITIVNGDNPETLDVIEPYYLSVIGTLKSTSINPVDGSVISVTEGCNEATARPVLFEH
jgi:hypothetical protein